jgi:hypothetical protein
LLDACAFVAREGQRSIGGCQSSDVTQSISSLAPGTTSSLTTTVDRAGGFDGKKVT